MSGPLKVCVCGGGNGAHALAGLAASCSEVETRVLTIKEDEADRWKNEITVVINERNGSSREIKSKPRMVTNNVKEAVTGSDMVILVMPAHAHGVFLTAISPHLGKNTLIVGLPGRPGFEFQCWNILGTGIYTVFSFEALPWECKILEYGKSVEIVASKPYLSGAMTRGRGICRRPPLMSLQMLHGAEPLFRQLRNFIEVILSPYSYMNVAIVYGQWRNWDGKPISDIPLFYESVTKDTSDILDECSTEVLGLAERIKSVDPTVNLSSMVAIGQWMLDNYKSSIENNKCLHSIITSNKEYKGVKHQMKSSDGGFVPDFDCLLDDLPMGLVVIKGIALVVGAEMPSITKLLEWGQAKIGKQYLVDGQLTGSDVSSTRCPQNYGLNTLESILSGKKEEQTVLS